MQHWIKKGRFFSVEGKDALMHSHAALPTLDPIGGDDYRLYFSSRDPESRSRVWSLDVRLESELKILSVRPDPVLDLGPLGAFDDRGAMPSCVVNYEGRKYLYYTGWSSGVTVPFYFFIGLAVQEKPDGPFRKVSPSPVVERNEHDPYLTASPCVRVENGRWRMWYLSGSRWEATGGKEPKHYYNIRHAESDDGVHWRTDGTVCIDYKDADEYAIARPWIVKEGGLYKMWFCHRGNAYRMGYAESNDGLRWRRLDDQAGLAASPDGWDSEMIAYPHLVNHRGEWHLFYNGNGYGKSGMGYAVLRKNG